ncbi:MAG: hypothetical protein Q7S16_03320 [bacterium]|nr:hypothetical protein [bacterium]
MSEREQPPKDELDRMILNTLVSGRKKAEQQEGRCSVCGAPTVNGANFCSGCGATFLTDEEIRKMGTAPETGK